MGLRRVGSLASVCLIIGATILSTAGPVSAGDDDRRGHVKVLLSGLNSPKALVVSSRKSVAIGAGAYGPPGPALEYFFKGPKKGTTATILDEVSIVDAVITRG